MPALWVFSLQVAANNTSRLFFFWSTLYNHWLTYIHTPAFSLSHLWPRFPVCTCRPPSVSWCCGLWPVWSGHSCTPSLRAAGPAGSRSAPPLSTACGRLAHSLTQRKTHEDLKMVLLCIYINVCLYDFPLLNSVNSNITTTWVCPSKSDT